MKVTYTNTVPMRVAVDSDSGEKRFEPAVDKTYDNIDVLPTKEDLAQIPNKDKDALYIAGEGLSKAIYALLRCMVLQNVYPILDNQE